MTEEGSNELGKQEELLNSGSRGELAGAESDHARALAAVAVDVAQFELQQASRRRLVEAARAYKVARDDLEQARASRTAAHPQQMVVKFDAFGTAQDALVAAALALDEAGGEPER